MAAEDESQTEAFDVEPPDGVRKAGSGPLEDIELPPPPPPPPQSSEAEGPRTAGNASKVESMRKNFEGGMKDLEAHDKMGNFEIQPPPPPPPKPAALATDSEPHDEDLSVGSFDAASRLDVDAPDPLEVETEPIGSHSAVVHDDPTVLEPDNGDDAFDG